MKTKRWFRQCKHTNQHLVWLDKFGTNVVVIMCVRVCLDCKKELGYYAGVDPMKE